MPIIRGADKIAFGVETTAGFSRIASVERMATCGALMIGAVNVVPKAPLLLIEYVPPARSSGVELASARFLDLPPHSLGEADKGQIARVPHDGHDKAIMRKVDSDAKVHFAGERKRLSVKASVDMRKGLIAPDRSRGR